MSPLNSVHTTQDHARNRAFNINQVLPSKSETDQPGHFSLIARKSSALNSGSKYRIRTLIAVPCEPITTLCQGIPAEAPHHPQAARLDIQQAFFPPSAFKISPEPANHALHVRRPAIVFRSRRSGCRCTAMSRLAASGSNKPGTQVEDWTRLRPNRYFGNRPESGPDPPFPWR